MQLRNGVRAWCGVTLNLYHKGVITLRHLQILHDVGKLSQLV